MPSRRGSQPSRVASGVGWIEAFDASSFPVRIAAEVRGFDPETVAPAKEVRRMERNVLYAVAAAKEAWAAGGIEDYDPNRVGIVVGSAIGGVSGIVSHYDVMSERGADRVSPFFIPSVLADTASGQIAISLGLKGPNYAPVSACASGSTSVGEGAELIKRGQADVVLAGGTEAATIPLILAGFCAMRGLVAEEEDPDARLATVRRDARRLRHGRGRLHPPPRGATRPRVPAARRSTPRFSATAPRTTLITWPNPSRRRRALRR